MNRKIDLLKFIPKKTSFGFKIFFEEIHKDKESWLKIWYKCPRLISIKLRRFIDQNILGSLLGQYQAEGSKSFKDNRRLKTEFSNSSIFEHKDFVNYLKELGIPKSVLNFELTDSSNTEIQKLNQLALDFEKELGIYPKIYKNYSKRGGYAFKTLFRNTILTNIILFTLHKLRKEIAKDKGDLKEFGDAFFAKLLTGDGSISINKKKIRGSVRIRIYDENKEYLEDYRRIMKNLGFKYTRMDKKHNAVEANCTLDNLLYLYEIKAFKNTNNWNKLLVIIGFYLKGKRVKIRLRLFDLQNKIFTSKHITKKYFLHPENRKWLNNMIKKGYIIRTNSKPPFKYKITRKSKEFISTVNKWNIDLKNLMKIKKTKDLFRLWDLLKIH